MKITIAYAFDRETKNNIVYKQIGGFNVLYIPKAAFKDAHPEELEATIVELKAKPVQVAAQ